MTVISFNGFTWTLAETVTPVLDVLGEPCVVGPVTLTAKTPATIGTGTGTRHGSMVNPASLAAQGYDGRMDLIAKQQGYDVALNVEKSLPYALPAGSALCSMQSGNVAEEPLGGGNAQMLERFGCLSVMASIPAAGTFFRPPYAGTERPLFLTSQVRTDWLPNLTATGDPVGDQVSVSTYQIDNPKWLTLPQYTVIQPSEPGHNRMAPRYQMMEVPSVRGKYIGQIGILAASNHARRVEMLHRIIRYGIDCAYTIRSTKNAVFLSGAGYGTGGQFFAIAVAGHYLQSAEILETLTRPWEDSLGQYSGPNPDLVGVPVGCFWETSSVYNSTDATSMYDLPKARSQYPNGPALYGDPRDQLGTSGNESRRDENGEYHAQSASQIRYAHPLVDGAATFPQGLTGWGGYMRNATPAFIAQYIAAKLLGVAHYYPPAARDYFYQYINDPKLWHDQDYSANAYHRDNYGFGGSGNGFAYAMWQAHGDTVNIAPQMQGTVTLRITV